VNTNSAIERILELSAEAQVKRRQATENSPAFSQLDRSNPGLWQSTRSSVKTQRSPDRTLLNQIAVGEMPWPHFGFRHRELSVRRGSNSWERRWSDFGELLATLINHQLNGSDA
jgi:hypothetical protein